MKVNFNYIFKNLDGSIVPKQTKKKVEKDGKMVIETVEEDLTLKSVCTDALLNQQQDDKMSGDDKVKHFNLAEIVYAGGEIDLKSEQIALLKELIGKRYFPLIVGPAFKVLEGK